MYSHQIRTCEDYEKMFKKYEKIKKQQISEKLRVSQKAFDRK